MEEKMAELHDLGPEMMPLVGLLKHTSTGFVGEKKNYNFQPNITQYEKWFASTIEWVPTEGKFKARVIVKNKNSNDSVVFNSWHQDYNDAERAIAHLKDSMAGTAERPIYNIFGETIDIHTSDMGGGNLTNVTEVLALIWSMMDGTTP